MAVMNQPKEVRPDDALTLNTLTRLERSTLAYVESCCVNRSGLLEAVRMNAQDYVSLKKFAEHGLVVTGRVPAHLLGEPGGGSQWCTLTDAGWALAHEVRRLRALQLSPSRRRVDAWLAEGGAQ